MLPGVPWIGDNGGFTGASRGLGSYFAWLAHQELYLDTCVFVTAPDVLCNARATVKLSRRAMPGIRALGYKVALVAQNGLEDMSVPWDEFDAFFIGGDTEWKLGPEARILSAEAKIRGKWLHMGRVNSLKRMRYAHDVLRCDSVDGTKLKFAPDHNLVQLLDYMGRVENEKPPSCRPLWRQDGGETPQPCLRAG